LGTAPAARSLAPGLVAADHVRVLGAEPGYDRA